MAIITEDYVSFEIAKLLKDKGFNESTQLVWYEHLPSSNAVHNSEIGKPKRDYFYWEKEGERNSPWTNNSPIPSYISGEVYSCPTLQMAMAWLREVHNLFICIEFDAPTFVADIYKMDEIDEHGCAKHIQPTIANCKTYEEAVEAALKYVLENLI